VTERKKPILAIVGPTGSGKSELGITLAVRFNGEIINCDSVQLYRGLHVGTAKVPRELRRGIIHHLVDVLEPSEYFTAGEYARLALQEIAEVESRDRLALLVGGTTFYLRAVRNPLFDSPTTDLKLRERFKEILRRRDAPHLHRMLRRLDPPAASRIAPNDWSRTIRALEFCFQTGQRFSEAQKNRPEPPEAAGRIRLIALHPPRQELYRRINARAEAMFQQGLIEEVEGLLRSGVPSDAKAFQAHGYRRVLQFLRGEISRERALELTQLDTRHYAKRQLTWLRHERDVIWFDGFGDDPRVQARVCDFVERLLGSLSG